MIGGDARIESVPGEGTAVEVDIPYSETESAPAC